MKSVYIETTVVSYLTARPSRDLIVAAHQQITSDWWERILPGYEAFVSPIVLEEAAKGNAEAAQRRLDALAHFDVLEVNAEVRKLADVYDDRLPIPAKAFADVYHLALAAWHGMDFLVSWNMTHLVNGNAILLVQEINAGMGIRTPGK